MMDGNEVKRIRRKLRVTQVEFAAMLGVSPTCVSRWECGSREIGPLADRAIASLIGKK